MTKYANILVGVMLYVNAFYLGRCIGVTPTLLSAASMAALILFMYTHTLHKED